jgi:hypothetical protein
MSSSRNYARASLGDLLFSWLWFFGGLVKTGVCFACDNKKITGPVFVLELVNFPIHQRAMVVGRILCANENRAVDTCTDCQDLGFLNRISLVGDENLHDFYFFGCG